MDLTQMIALAEIDERERDMRARRQTHELLESRRAHAASGLRERLGRFATAALTGRPNTDSRGATCPAC